MWQRLSAGYVLASLVVVKAVAMPAAIVAMLIVEAATTGELAVAPIAIFAVTAAAPRPSAGASTAASARRPARPLAGPLASRGGRTGGRPVAPRDGCARAGRAHAA